MSDSLEAFGALTTAGLVAQSLDRPGQGHPHQATDGTPHCLNCDAPLSGAFCANCGQRGHVHRSLLHVGEEFLHGITHFDGKAWKTLPMLFFRPGTLTREYILGRRARYIAPVPLFLLVVFLMFFVLSLLDIKGNLGGVDIEGAEKQTQGKMTEVMADIDRQIAAARARGDRAEVERLGIARNALAALGGGVVVVPHTGMGKAGVSASDVIKASENGKVNLHFVGLPQLDGRAKEALKNPRLLIYKLQTKAYKLSFLLVPMSLPWMWLAFVWRRGVRMYDHAIFTLYSISFMSLLFIIGSLLLVLDVESQFVWVPFLLLPAVHMFMQLRGTYSLGLWSAIWRTTFLSVAAMVTLTSYMVMLLVIGLLD